MVILRCPDSLLECQLCMDDFISPRMLPCQHTFCTQCALALLKTTCERTPKKPSGVHLSCPVCRRKFELKNKDTTNIDDHLLQFPESLLLKSLLDISHGQGVDIKDVVADVEPTSITTASQTGPDSEEQSPYNATSTRSMSSQTGLKQRTTSVQTTHSAQKTSKTQTFTNTRTFSSQTVNDTRTVYTQTDFETVTALLWLQYMVVYRFVLHKAILPIQLTSTVVFNYICRLINNVIQGESIFMKSLCYVVNRIIYLLVAICRLTKYVMHRVTMFVRMLCYVVYGIIIFVILVWFLFICFSLLCAHGKEIVAIICLLVILLDVTCLAPEPVYVAADLRFPAMSGRARHHSRRGRRWNVHL